MVPLTSICTYASYWSAKKKAKKGRDSLKDAGMNYQISAAVKFLQSQIYLAEGLGMVILHMFPQWCCL